MNTVADPVAVQDTAERQREIVRALQAALPAHALLWRNEDTVPYECDGLTAYRQRPLVVALPETEAQVQAVLRSCHALNVPVVALSQLNRDNEKTADKRPSLGGLRGSGAIAAEADTVLLLHRPAATEQGGPQETEGEINIAKQRSGPTGPVKVMFHGAYTTFRDFPEQR